MNRRILALFLALAFASTCPAVADEKFDTTLIFKQSKTYRQTVATNPGRIKLLVGEASEKHQEFSIIEDHPTHIVTLAHLRLSAGGDIWVRVLDDDGEEIWRNDKLKVKRRVKFGRRR